MSASPNLAYDHAGGPIMYRLLIRTRLNGRQRREMQRWASERREERDRPGRAKYTASTALAPGGVVTYISDVWPTPHRALAAEIRDWLGMERDALWYSTVPLSPSAPREFLAIMRFVQRRAADA